MNIAPQAPTTPPDTLGPQPYRYAAPDPWGSVRTAGFGVRAAARVLDLMVRVLVSWAMGVAYGIFLAISDPDRVQALSTAGAHTSGYQYIAGFAGGILYHAVTECYGGASPGKILCGLRVTTPTLGRATPGGALVRNLAILIDGAFFGLVARSAMSSSDKRQRHGDRWGNTVVVHAEGAPDAVRRTGGELALWACAGLAIEASFVLASLVLTYGAG